MSNTDLKSLEAKTLLAEKETQAIQEEIDKLVRGDLSYIQHPQLDKLLSDNEKLKHRVAILENAIETIKSPPVEEETIKAPKKLPTLISDLKSIESTICVADELKNIFTIAIYLAYPDLEDPPVVINVCANHPKFGDYQCNSAMQISKLLKSQHIRAHPRDVASKIVSKVPLSPLVGKVEVAGAGFINIFLHVHFVEHVLNVILTSGVKPPPVKRQKIVVDFSSPNIAKEMHVGHLRSTIIGDSICRLLEFLNHDVLRINHLGDWGTQFGMLIAHLQEKFPDYKTHSPPISDLQEFYKESKQRFDEDPEFKKIAYSCVVLLQSGHPDYTAAWKLICEVSRQEFQNVYDRLDIKLIDRGESFYQSRMDAIVKELKEKDLLENDGGRLIMWGEEVGRQPKIPLTIVKSGGGYTYDTSDMATIKQRVEEEKAERLIYVTDAGQFMHFSTIESCARRAGILKEDQKIEHVGFGVVLGEDRRKFKTRSGDTIKLTALMDEGLKRALDKLTEKGRHLALTSDELLRAQQAIAYGCIKYADLSHNRINDYVFSFDKMLDDKGNTAVYLLYALTRIKSISRTAGVSIDMLLKEFEKCGIKLLHVAEWRLGKVLLKFPEVILKVANDLYLHSLCEYLYEISTSFTEFYDNCYCVEKDASGNITEIHYGRLMLCEVTDRVMTKCFDILGIKTVSKM